MSFLKNGRKYPFKKMALEIRRDTLAKQETNLGAEEKQKIVAAIHNFGAIKFNSTLVHDRVETLESLIKQLTTYKEQLSWESDVDLQNFNSKVALQLVSKRLINDIFTEEARKYINETRQMNAHDYSGVQFVASRMMKKIIRLQSFVVNIIKS